MGIEYTRFDHRPTWTRAARGVDKASRYISGDRGNAEYLNNL